MGELQTDSTMDILNQDEKTSTSFRNSRWQPYLNAVLLHVLTAHFCWATWYFIDNGSTLRYSCCDGYGFLIILYLFIVYGFAYVYIIKPYLLQFLADNVSKPIGSLIAKLSSRYAKWAVYVGLLVLIVAYLIWDTWDNKRRLVPAAGLVVFLSFGYIFSNNKNKINWDTIIRGLILQFLFGLITLRWETGRNIFGCAGDKVTTFLGYAKNGSAFVYGSDLVLNNPVFAFEAISTIYFLGFMINILYHIGVMQKIVVNLGLVLQAIMGTSICESVNAAANIFLGQTEAPLLLKPYLSNLTSSELHAVMTAGFASVSGTVLAAYISYGANAAHLITASVMAAPAGLVFSKLMYPETETTAATKESIALTGSEYSSVLEAASQGASQATQIVLGIIANLIAFIATVYFVNGVLGWFGALVGFEGDDTWSIELIVGYIFTPISYVMGIKWEECRKVGSLIGLKMMVNEFAAFSKFQEMNLSEHSKIIATFAICGFANPGSIGIMISALSSLIPSKSSVITANVFRAFVSGSVVCFTTACIAGMLTP